MNLRLAGKTAIVTGGLSGTGAAIAQRMASEGATVIAADWTANRTELSSSSSLRPSCLHVDSLYVDVQDPANVDAMLCAVVARHGRLDCLVNSAGISSDTPFLETSLDTFDRIVAVNLRGTFIVGQAAALAMKETGGGSIVNIASVSGIAGNACRSAVGASKCGVIGLSRAMAVDLAAFGIRVNVLAPGAMETPPTPLQRCAHLEQVAGGVVFLCSADASSVTGHVLVVDGGFSAAGLTGAISHDEMLPTFGV